jgi:hypothetical protein
MAWNGIEDFDSYTPGTTMSAALQGGTGWEPSDPVGWIDLGGGDFTVETAPAGGQGGIAARSISTTAGTEVIRWLANGTDAGSCWFRMRISIVNPSDVCGVVFVQYETDRRFYIQFDTGGDITIYNGDTDANDVVLADYVVDTWYTIKVEWDATNQAGKFRVTVDAGTPSAWTYCNGKAFTSIAGFLMKSDKTNAGTFWVDDIRDSAPSGGTGDVAAVTAEATADAPAPDVQAITVGSITSTVTL